MHGEQRQSLIPPPHHDEGSVCQLRRTEDDRRGRAQPEEDSYAQDQVGVKQPSASSQFCSKNYVT